ncbi:hypothetical protein [Hymenobacter properus]|uniref:Magnesium citrate secondary transporter n=1 Tax=Hymenobacter properus TaxID=2791026 RepID=A0A931FMI9_9BACT|nr:hypothetical protein [Hymenobacter properus]MBF9141719.1 hypothetical protein [Hymenobacter properus]MBR7720528.1 hypothetical protein [Microvirga sp. SRT04]
MRVPAVLCHPLFGASALLYSSIQLNKRWLHWPLPAWFTSYLSDVLCLPLVLSLALAAHQLVYGRRATLPGTWVLAAWAGVALWFEALLPRWSARAVADPWDVLAYAAGAIVFHRWLNKPS